MHALLNKLLGRHALELAQGIAQRAAQQAWAMTGGSRWAPPTRLADDRGRPGPGPSGACAVMAQRFGGVGRACRRCVHRIEAQPSGEITAVGRVLQHQHGVADGDRQRAAGAAFADDGRRSGAP